MASLVIPAHNESAVIGRLLGGLSPAAAAGELDVVVVCNGCTDDTADVANGFPGVQVVETPVPSKSAALRLGDEKAATFPRVYIDADIELSAEAVRLLCAALNDATQAAGPARVLDLGGASWIVRSYYRVWEQLPQVRAGLFGRGVIAMSRAAHDRVAALPDAMSDDLAISEEFSDAERAIVPDARVVIRVPRTARDLIRRRIRVHLGNAELDSRSGRAEQSQTSPKTLLAMVRREPRLAPHMPVFVGVAVVAKLGARRNARRGDLSWQRDESSRA